MERSGQVLPDNDPLSKIADMKRNHKLCMCNMLSWFVKLINAGLYHQRIDVTPLSKT